VKDKSYMWQGLTSHLEIMGHFADVVPVSQSVALVLTTQIQCN